MSDAEVGLIIVGPVIIAFSFMLYRAGVLQGIGMLSIVAASTFITLLLLLGQ